MTNLFFRTACVAGFCCGLLAPAAAQQPPQSRPGGNGTAAPAAAALPPSFIIGVSDVLSVAFWRDPRMSADVVVRPDGMISVPLLNDVRAAGNTPEQLAGVLAVAAAKYITDADVTVVVKEIHSRKVFVLGNVGTPGMVVLTGDMNVLQLIAVSGGLLEYADKDDITIIRTENGQEKRLKFNYNDVLKGKNAKQNVLLQPGDTVVVR
jgi:polysaccharide export outer membrane protein